MKNENIISVAIRTETIRLQDFLKFCNAVSSGGEAKIVIQDGAVEVNGETETRRGRKLHPDDTVRYNGESWRVTSDGAS